MSYRKATPQDIGKECRYRHGDNQPMKKGTIQSVDNGVALILPRWGSSCRPAWRNIEVPE